jgi:hypothetical protein
MKLEIKYTQPNIDGKDTYKYMPGISISESAHPLIIAISMSPTHSFKIAISMFDHLPWVRKAQP